MILLPKVPQFDPSSEPAPSNAERALTYGVIGASVFGLHRHFLATQPSYGSSLYHTFSAIEERSPGHILRTFGLSEMFSPYLTNRIEVPYSKLISGGALSDFGGHLQRLLGPDINLFDARAGLLFERDDLTSPWFNLKSDLPGSLGKKVIFRERGSSTGSSSHWKGTLRPEKPVMPAAGDPGSRIWGYFKSLQKTQRPKGYSGFAGATERYVENGIEVEGLGRFFQPYLGATEGRPVQNFLQEAEIRGLGLVERMGRLMADAGVGIPNRSYNRLFSMPFVRGENRGFFNVLFSKRVIPAYLIAGVGLPYLDYLLGHPSNAAIDAYQKVRLAHAEATDRLPGMQAVTDAYAEVVPGAQYGPLALPLAGGAAGGLLHYSKVLAGAFTTEQARRRSARIFAKAEEADEVLFRFFNKSSPVAKGFLVGLAAMIPFIPGMLGSRQSADELRRVYSGEEPVAIRSGRWWEMGTTPWGGSRIKEYRPHWSLLWKTQAEKTSLYGSEDEYWAHHPLLHPIRYLRDPYWLEERNYADRPYPISSPALSDVPLFGPILAATVGKLIKPPRKMHLDEWDQTDYSLYSTRLEPKGPGALPPPTPEDEFSIGKAVNREVRMFADFIGLPGFIGTSIYDRMFPDQELGKHIDLQGSRQMTSSSRRYYERELGAGLFMDIRGEAFGYTEPYRRFIQPDPGLADANEIPNKMPDWLPGDDYFVNFRVGDPYAKISEGFARLPGAGYEALHPEVKGMSPDEYPDIVKMSILGDVAPYSKEFQIFRSRVSRAAINDTELEIEYDKIMDRVRAMRESVLRTDTRRFSAETDEAEGTIAGITSQGIELKEYPGRTFRLSSLGYSAADLSALVLAENNNLTRSEVARAVDERRARFNEVLMSVLAPGTSVSITVPKGALEHATVSNAVIRAGNRSINEELIEEGLAVYDRDAAGPETQAMFGPVRRTLGRFAEDVSFFGDESPWNPMRYIPSPGHTKLWQERTALSQYLDEEVMGTRFRRWEKPLHDFLAPYFRGLVRRTTGQVLVPEQVQKRRSLNTLSDMLEYLRDMTLATQEPENRGRYTSQASRTAIGANLFGSSTYVGSTLPDRDAHYFRRFLMETDPDKREQILKSVSPEMAKALAAQWVSQDADIAAAEGSEVPPVGEGGRLYTKAGLADYAAAETDLGYGDYQRSMEIAQFFSETGLNLPGPESPLWDPGLDYEDVKLKIIQQEGYDVHDFNIFDDRAALLWRKPYVDGAVRELTSGNQKSVEQIRRTVEQLILAAKDRNPKVSASGHKALRDRSNIVVDVDVDEREKLYQDIRRNPEKYN